MTERKTNGHSPLVEIIAEVYDTKRRMKEVINKAIETNSDDFEEYGVLTTNARNTMWNNGIADGWSDGWHSVFPNDPIDPEDYEEYLRPLETYTPSIPQYSTETYIDNLVTIMQDNYRCRLLIKDALETSSEEFVTYPDLLDAYIESEYNTAYDQAYQKAYEQAVDLSYTPPTIEQHYLTAEIINNADFGSLYYWTDGETIDNKHLYTGPISITHRMNIWAVLFYNGRYSQIVHRVLIIPEEEYFTLYLLDEPTGNYLTPIESTFSNDTEYQYSVDDGAWMNAVDTGSRWGIPNENIHKTSSIKFRGNIRVPIGVGGSIYEPMGNFLSLFDGTNYGGITMLSSITNNFTTQCYTNNGMIQFGGNRIENIGFTATGMSPYCYSGMFSRSTASVLPHIPNASLAEGCYYDMFGGCTNITSAPNIFSSTTLAEKCYAYMFSGCTSLVNVYDLPAITLKERCYEHMFSGCTSLVNGPKIYGEVSQHRIDLGIDGIGGINTHCCDYMFSGCTSLTSVECHLPCISTSVFIGVLQYGEIAMYMLPDTNIGTIKISHEAWYDNLSIPEGWTIDYYDTEDTQIDYSQQYLTLKALSYGDLYYIGTISNYQVIYYSLNNGNWTMLEPGDGPIYLNPYDVVRFYGNNSAYHSTPTESIWGHSISFYGICNMYGNIMSMIDGQSFTNGGTLAPSAFENALLPFTIAHAKNLVLPATNLGYRCYEGLFSQTGQPRYYKILLDTPKELPATDLTDHNQGTTFGLSNVYNSMFLNNTRITSGPEIKATELPYSSCDEMFKGCTKLNSVKCTATTLNTDCSVDWLSGVSSTGTFTKASGVTWPSGDSGIPTGWTVVDAA